MKSYQYDQPSKFYRLGIDPMKDAHCIHIKVEQLDELLLSKPDIRTGSQLMAEFGERLDEESQTLSNKHSLKLLLTIKNDRFDDSNVVALRSAIESYFLYRVERMKAHRSTTIHRGLDSVKVGFVFLILLLVAAELIGYVEGRLSDVVSEGLTVLAWVALWRPTEELVYDWYPYTREIDRYRRLMKISIVLEGQRKQLNSYLQKS